MGYKEHVDKDKQFDVYLRHPAYYYENTPVKILIVIEIVLSQ